MTDVPDGHRDYLDRPNGRDGGRQPQSGEQDGSTQAGPPPGSGTVWVNFDGERWWASWQDGPACRDFHSADESEVMQWAQQQPAAARSRFDPASNDDVAF
jgi:hypothetical protein